MKKKIIIIVISIVLIGLVAGGIFFVADGGLKHYQMNNQRINDCTSLSKYVEYHDAYYMTVVNNNSSIEDFLEFHAKNIKCDVINEKNILYYDDEGFDFDIGLLILDDYTLYETAFNNDKLYSNGQQYKKIETDIEIKQMKVLFNKPYFISNDDKYYKIENKELKELNVNYMAYYEYAQYTTLLKDDSIKKTISRDRDNIVVIKNDGQVYKQEYKYNSNDETYNLISETVLLSNEEYGNVLDCVYSQWQYEPDPTKKDIVTVVSDNGLYYLKQTSEQQYIDSVPTKELVLSDIYNKYKTDIKFIDSNYIFTTDNNIIRTHMLCRDIDKEVK